MIAEYKHNMEIQRKFHMEQYEALQVSAAKTQSEEKAALQKAAEERICKLPPLTRVILMLGAPPSNENLPFGDRSFYYY